MAAGAGRATVLVVDDDEAIRTLVRELLADEGYGVITAEDGAQALQMLDGQEPDLILLDMRMPVMDGWALASAYRERPAQSAPIIVVTAATDARRTATEVNAAGYLGKPFDLDDLIAVVERTLERSD
jgi:two-component system, chemotaxis family, chemotaxis protein CheY